MSGWREQRTAERLSKYVCSRVVFRIHNFLNIIYNDSSRDLSAKTCLLDAKEFPWLRLMCCLLFPEGCWCRRGWWEDDSVQSPVSSLSDVTLTRCLLPAAFPSLIAWVCHLVVQCSAAALVRAWFNIKLISSLRINQRLQLQFQMSSENVNFDLLTNN